MKGGSIMHSGPFSFIPLDVIWEPDVTSGLSANEIAAIGAVVLAVVLITVVIVIARKRK